MKILINRYHPVCEDIAITLSKLGHEVTLSVKTDINDHYGSWKEILKVLKGTKGFRAIDYKQALILASKKSFDLIGADGLFEGDRQLFELAGKTNIPTFAIAGYPHLMDEPSGNILSLGWSLPILQYLRDFPTEAHRKQVDWKAVAESGRMAGKNICVFYPNFWDIKDRRKKGEFYRMEIAPLQKFVSGIQRYEECNRFNHQVFTAVQKALHIEKPPWPTPWQVVENYEGLPRDDFLQKLAASWGLLHLKHADQPGISVMEALLMGKKVFTMKSFILGSHNHDMLIDGHNAVIADTVDELIERMEQVKYDQVADAHENMSLVSGHINMLTSFERQKDKLNKFVLECLKN